MAGGRSLQGCRDSEGFGTAPKLPGTGDWLSAPVEGWQREGNGDGAGRGEDDGGGRRAGAGCQGVLEASRGLGKERMRLALAPSQGLSIPTQGPC